MKRIVISILVATSIACAVAVAAAATGGQPIPKVIGTDDGTPGGGQGPGIKSPRITLPPDTQAPAAGMVGPAFETSYPFGSTINFSGSFSDNGGTHTATWTIGGNSFAGTVDEGSGTVSGVWTPSMPGYYIVTLTITDQAGNSSTVSTAVIVFDRGDGFMTGHGKLPQGASDYFDFNVDVRYRKDDMVPTGSVSFKRKSDGWQFDATTMDWFVVDIAKGLLRGTGTINGQGSYRYLVSGLDGDDLDPATVDKMRFQVRDMSGNVIFDNQPGAPDTASGAVAMPGAYLQVRLPNGGLGHLSAVQPRVESSSQGLVHGFELAQNFPNPFRASTQVRFSLPQRSNVKLAVFDVAGREVASLADGAWDAGSHAVSWSGATAAGGSAHGGVYFVRLAVGASGNQAGFVATRKMVLQD